MRTTIATLEAAQKTLLQPGAVSPADRQAVLGRLTEQVPAPILAHYLRLIEQGRPGVAWVRNGVCSVCHIRVPSALAGLLVKPDDVHLCEHCGSYLLLAPDAVPPPPVPPLPRARRVKRAGAAPVVAA